MQQTSSSGRHRAQRWTFGGGALVGYVELHCHSGFSFLDGASSPADLAAAAAAQGHEALAITDHDGVWGAMEFAAACQPLGVRPIVGAEVTLEVPGTERGTGRDTRPRGLRTGMDARPAREGRMPVHRGWVPDPRLAHGREAHVTLLVESVAGWRNLCLLLTEAHAHTRGDPARSELRSGAPRQAHEGESRFSAAGRDSVDTRMGEGARAGGASGDTLRGGTAKAGESGAAVPGTARRDALPPSLALEVLERHAEGLVCLSGCARQGALAGIFERAGGNPSGADSAEAVALGERLVRAFGRDGFRVELQRPRWRHDHARNRWLSGLAERLGVPCVATGNVHAHDPSRTALQDALVAIRLGGSLDETGALRRGNRQAVLRPPEEMARLFAEHPKAADESGRLAERLRFNLLSDHGYRYPGSEDESADRELAELCAARFEGRYAGTPERQEAKRRLEEELRVIRKLRLSGFFRLHADLLELAREVAREVRGPDSARGILPPGRGRGSSVSSVVCYLTGLSHVDPVRAGLFLGRFLNEELNDVPDIDLDFPRDVRERLIPRIHERYGPERSALVAAFPTFRVKGSIRELGKALGLPPTEIERVARAVDGWAGENFEADVEVAVGAKRAETVRWRALTRLVREAWGLPRHASQHSGGMVLATRPLNELCPIVPAAMEGRQIVMWDKDSCADAGFLKIDLLGLGMLSAVERTIDEVARTRSERLDLSRIRLDDPKVYEAIQNAETTGVFQIESRAQMQMLPRSLPENLDDLTVQVALVRPGPIQGGAVHPYLERKALLREDPSYVIPYEHPSLEPILADTLGAIFFQDQVIQVAMALAGFSAGEAEGLRRAMSRKRSDEAMAAYAERFVEGAISQGVEREVAERVFEQVRGFSGFGFPKSHSAAFGLLAYQSTWLRVYRGPEFLCALLNEQPMGFYPPDALVHEAQRRGIELRKPDVNASEVDCVVTRRAETSSADPYAGAIGTFDPHDGGEDGESELVVRIGLGYISGLRKDDAQAVVDERKRSGRYGSLAELASRSGIRDDALGRLAWAGACESIEPDAEGARREARRIALWRLGVASGAGPHGQLSLPLPLPEAPKLRELDEWEIAVADYASTRMTVGTHPLALIRSELEDAVPNEDLAIVPDRSELEIAGIVVARQRPGTAKGVVFMLLEDETGVANVIVPPRVYTECRLAVRTASYARVFGRLERRGKVINVLAGRVEPLATPDLPQAEVRSIEPDPLRETGGFPSPAPQVAAAGALAAVAPAPQSFGGRG
jgi:error-prone DNA polymerase